MAKFNPYILPVKERKRIINQFYSAISTFKDLSGIKKFFDDLLTESEVIMLARRLEIAKLLIQGVGYQKIRTKLKVGFDNINAVNCWLRYGRDSYVEVIKKLEKLEAKKNRRKSEIKNKKQTFDWDDVKKRYPPQFWPKELLKELENTVDKYKSNKKIK